jgi:hypothetical protein
MLAFSPRPGWVSFDPTVNNLPFLDVDVIVGRDQNGRANGAANYGNFMAINGHPFRQQSADCGGIRNPQNGLRVSRSCDKDTGLFCRKGKDRIIERASRAHFKKALPAANKGFASRTLEG